MGSFHTSFVKNVVLVVFVFHLLAPKNDSFSEMRFLIFSGTLFAPKKDEKKMSSLIFWGPALPPKKDEKRMSAAIFFEAKMVGPKDGAIAFSTI